MRQRRAPAPITARQIDTFRRELTQRECSPGTVENYVRSVRAFARWNREAPVTRGRAAEWRRSLAETHAPATVNAMLAGLSKFFALTGREDCRVRPLRLQHRSFRPAERELSRAEYRSLVCTARAEGRERLALLMETVCATGIRVGEVRYITVEAARRGRADIALKGKLRTILLPARLCRRLLKFAGKNKIAFGAIFLTKSGCPLSRTQIWAEMKRLCAKAGVAAEVIGLPNGSIGDALYRAKITLSTGELFAWTFVIILLSAAFEKLFLRALDAVSRALIGGEEDAAC